MTIDKSFSQKITPIHFIPKFCSQCGAPLGECYVPEERRERLLCSKCGTVSYLNPFIVAGVIPEQDKKIVLLKRGIEPAYGAWTFPAGFVELGESVKEGAIRETKEETGLDVSVGELLGIYSYKNVGVVTIVYMGKVMGGSIQTCPESAEVKMFQKDEIPWDQLAFNSTKDALRDWEKMYG